MSRSPIARRFLAVVALVAAVLAAAPAARAQARMTVLPVPVHPSLSVPAFRYHAVVADVEDDAVTLDVNGASIEVPLGRLKVRGAGGPLEVGDAVDVTQPAVSGSVASVWAGVMCLSTPEGGRVDLPVQALPASVMATLRVWAKSADGSLGRMTMRKALDSGATMFAPAGLDTAAASPGR